VNASSNKLNILHITTFLQGGAGYIISDLACAQSHAGHTVTVVASRTGEESYGNYPVWIEKLESAGIPLLQVDSTFKRDVALNISAFKTIRSELNWNHLSIVHSHAAIPSLVSLLLTSRARQRIPVLQTMHGWGITKTAAQAATDITLMNSLDCVVAVSAASQRQLIELGVEHNLVKLIPCGVAEGSPSDQSSIPASLHRWKSMGLKVLLCVGTIGPRKNQSLLVRALASPEAPRNIACVFIGEGEEIGALNSQVEKAGLMERVQFWGYRKDAARYLNYADWLILPSRDEGLPISLLEAYRNAVPIIGSDIPQIMEVVIHGKTGLLFRSEDFDSLVEVLKKAATLDEDHRRALGNAGRLLWKNNYTLKMMEERYESVYRQLILGN
jgi:L-malate glycosyltransferase